MHSSAAEELWTAARERMYRRFSALLQQYSSKDSASQARVVEELLDEVVRPEFFGAMDRPVWSVMRQDDNGNSFEIAGDLSRSDAQDKLQHLEASAHKQYYWLTPKAPIVSGAVV